MSEITNITCNIISLRSHFRITISKDTEKRQQKVKWMS